jgi:hypothetical protein
VQPQGGWGNRDLPVYFSRIPRFPTRTPTRAIQTATGHPDNSGLAVGRKIGTIVGAVIGGLVVLIVLLSVLLLLLRRIKKQRRIGSSSRPAELPAVSGTPDLLSAHYSQEPKHPISEQQPIVPRYVHSPTGTTTQSASPATSPRGRSPGGHVPTWESSFTPNSTYSHPQAVFPLGPYYPAQEQPVTAGAENNARRPYPEADIKQTGQPQHSFQQLNPNDFERPRPAPSPSNYSEATETDQRQSMNKTPIGFYPQPLNVSKQKSREDMIVATSGPPPKSAARIERSARNGHGPGRFQE